MRVQILFDTHIDLPGCPPNGRFPDSQEATRAARQNKDMECPEIPSGNHGMVNVTNGEFPDTNRC